jgi:Fibronectin type III domain
MRKAERVVVGRIVATLLTGSLAIALAGCGGGDSGTGSTGSANSVATTNPFAPATGAAADTNTNTSGSSTKADAPASGTTPPPSTAATSSVTLAWQPPTTNSNGSPITDLAGYKIHYGTESEKYTQEVSVANAGLTRYVVDNLAKGTYYFAISAYNSQGVESALSAEVKETLSGG